MKTFQRSNMKNLKEFIYSSCIHDAQIEGVRHNLKNNTFVIETTHPFFQVKMLFTFNDVSLVLFIKGNEDGNSDTIASLTVEDDFSYLHQHITNEHSIQEDDLYLLFQAFSMDELHVVCHSVSIKFEA